MTIINDLKYHYNKLNNLKNKIQNIIDTDKDGITDNIQIRTSDGQLKSNPDKDDISKVIKELEHLENQIEYKINEIQKYQYKNKEFNRNIRKQSNRSKAELSR